APRAAWQIELARLANQNTMTPGVEMQQAALFEQFTRVMLTLSRQAPLILTLDDLQWADAGSLDLLFHLGRRLAEGRILLVVTYRADEVALGRGTAVSSQRDRHPLIPVANELQRIYGQEIINLDSATETAGRAFVAAYLDEEPNRLDDAFKQALYQHTDGHPLFTVELLRHLQERGDLTRDDAGNWTARQEISWVALPARVEAVIEERLGRLSDDMREWLSAACVEGVAFTAQVIAGIHDVDERTLVRRLSRELDKQHRLIGERERQQVNGRRLYLFRFRHALYQQHIYNNLGEIERGLLHEDVGLALETLYGNQAGEIAPQLAWHFAEAGLAEKAIRYSLLAGDQARRLYAHHEAIGHYQQALTFLRQQGEPERLARALMKLGLTFHNAFDFQQARQAYEEGFALWQRVGEIQPSLAHLPAPHALRMAALEPLTLDPGRYQDDASAQMIYHLFSGLVELGPEMNVVPDVAQSWQVLEDGRRYIFHLRDDVYWSDGVPVTAVDFEFAWKRILQPGSSERPGNYLYDIHNARAYHQGELANDTAVGVQALDERTLAVTLTDPTSYLPQLLTVATTFPVPRHVVVAQGDAWTTPSRLVTNGPFRLVSWEVGKTAVLEQNPAYHGHFGGNVKQVEALFRPNEGGTFRQMVDRGQLDAFHLNLLPPGEQEQARQRHAGEYVTGPILSTTYVGFNVA
ncbi:MAG: AAA family ATPase, partial [Anaerolineales bacterium]|nr:AAA family ATPase [Anaerolineales bacterium]